MAASILLKPFSWTRSLAPTDVWFRLKHLKTHLHRRYHNTERDTWAYTTTRTQSKHHSFSLWSCYSNCSSCCASYNKRYEWPDLRRLSGVYQKANLEHQYRSETWEYICPPSDILQLLESDTNLVEGPSHRILDYSAMCFFECDLLHLALCNCCTQPLKLRSF